MLSPLAGERRARGLAALSDADASDGALWLFGYGSLIWRPGFAFVESRPAHVRGWARRFWQGSHDHRGVPGAPGRVVTLVPEAGSRCRGMAWRVAAELAATTLERLDHREQDGYAREDLSLHLDDGRVVDGVTWVAPAANPSWLGPAPIDWRRGVETAVEAWAEGGGAKGS